ncbi:hypothetical protein ACUND2_22690 [Serratia sp. IR-2025]
MSLTIKKQCVTNVRLSEYGNAFPGETKEFELTLSNPDINTLHTLDPDTNELVYVHEVVYTVTVEGQLNPGYLTKVIYGIGESNRDEILQKAEELILAD